MSMIIMLGFAAALTAAGLTLWYLFFKSHADRYQTSGYLPPVTGPLGRFGFAVFSYLLTFLTVGKVKVIRKARLPGGRLVIAANHQLPCDFAMLRRGAGRHFNMLTAADQLGGTFGVLSAAGGVISVNFKKKEDGALAEKGCVKALKRKLGIDLSLVAFLMASVFVITVFELPLLGALMLAGGLIALFAAPVYPALGIFPEGSLLPDNPDMNMIFRPGAIRIARAAASESCASVTIVPMAIHYKRDPAGADWTHRYLKGMRSMFPAIRNPKTWDPIFKVKLDELSQSEKAEVLARQEELKRAYARSGKPVYGGVVVVGEPVSLDSLPADPIEAANKLHTIVAELMKEARQH